MGLEDLSSLWPLYINVAQVVKGLHGRLYGSSSTPDVQAGTGLALLFFKCKVPLQLAECKPT